MPNRIEHLKKAKHNEDFYSSFNIDETLYRDWVVAGIFYAALHFIDAYYSAENKHFFAHGMRDEWIKNDWRLSKIYFNYRDLKEYRQKASYKIYEFSTQEIKNDILPHLESIKKFLYSLKPSVFA